MNVTKKFACEQRGAFAIMPSPMWVRAGVAQLVRVPACHAGGRGFKSRRPRHRLIAVVAQLVEQWTENPCVAGSIPACGTIFYIAFTLKLVGIFNCHVEAGNGLLSCE